MENWRRFIGVDGTYEWESENFNIIRSGGTDRSGHFTYNLGAYGLEDIHREFWGWFDTLREAKDAAETIVRYNPEKYS